MRRFQHVFYPEESNPAGDEVTLTTLEIEDAGIREVLQAPGASLGSWSILDALLDQTSSDFRFLEPLGKSREVKTALSGLFGRFVARAYATHVLHYTHFAHISHDAMPLDQAAGARVVRRYQGDLPDWIAWQALGGFAVVEAKGSHESGLPLHCLERARRQAERVDLKVAGKDLPLKRYAIATRWAWRSTMTPVIAVHDPEQEGSVSDEQKDQAGIGVARLHYASLLKPLGHVELAEALREATRTSQKAAAPIKSARAALDKVRYRRMESEAGALMPEILGGYVTRAGPIAASDVVSLADETTLRKLALGPVFVGVDREVLEAVVEGDARALERIQARDRLRVEGQTRTEPRTDGAGDWIVRLDDDRFTLTENST